MPAPGAPVKPTEADTALYAKMQTANPVLGARAGWDTGFLEGVYRQWFRAAGMMSVLDVRYLQSDHPDVATYTLSRVF